MIGEEAPDSLNVASQRFSRFLRENGYPQQVVWVDQTDVVWDRHHLCVCVRERPTQGAWDRACWRYADGVRNGFGVKLLAFSEVCGATIAAVFLPKDADAAKRHLMPRSGLKLSAATKKLSARRVTNGLTWLILSLRHRVDSRSFWDDYLGCS